MQSNTVSVDQDVSVLGMLQLDDPDNILVNGIEIVHKFRDMLLMRLDRAEQPGGRIHIQPYLLDDALNHFRPYFGKGSHVVLWDDTEIATLEAASQLTVVHTNYANPVRREGFLVIRTPSFNRILIAWEDMNSEIAGVLITNPDTAERIANRLDGIIQSSAH